MNGLTFPELEPKFVRHVFTLRTKEEIDSSSVEKVLTREFCFESQSFIYAQQPHESKVACVTHEHRGKTMPGVDALITNDPMVTLVIRTADCGPIFIYDPDHHAIGLVHSGRRGTELQILTHTIGAMQYQFVTDPSKLIVILGPCIRPPLYEVDFAAEIRHQAVLAGVKKFRDCRCNTAEDLERFYSYRMEKGNTGRHYSAIALVPRAKY